MKLFQTIESVTETLDGWCSKEKAAILASAVIALRPEVIVEIGVWGGRSLLPMALAAQETGRGIVYGIDPWQAEASVAGQEEVHRQWWAGIDHEAVYLKCIKTLAIHGVQNVVKLARKKSDDVEVMDNIGLLHIDGNHSDQAVRDVERFAPNVRPGGLVFSDDLNWQGGAVLRSVAALKRMGFVELYRVDTGMMLQRV